jgi:hypothetical protein
MNRVTGGKVAAMRNTTEREAELMVEFAKKGVHPTDLNRKVAERIAADQRREE